LIAVALGVAYWAAAPEGLAGADAGDPELVARGAEIYAAQCATCHGKNLEGEANWRVQKPSGVLPAPPHDESGHTWHHGDDQLFAITKRGGQPFMPPGMQSAMPAFEAGLTDRDIWAVLAYIKSRWPDNIQARQARVTEAQRER